MSLAIQPLRLAGPQTPFKVTGVSNKLRAAAVRVNMSGRIVRCSAEKQDGEKSFAEKFAIPAAALIGAALLFAGTPDEALAARSGGRMGGSSFSSRPRMAPAMPRSGGGGGGGGAVRSGGASRTYNTYVAPPLISPYGYGMPMFGGGMGFFPMFGIGPIFNIMVVFFILNVVLNTIRSFTSGNEDGKTGGKSSESIDDDEKW